MIPPEIDDIPEADKDDHGYRHFIVGPVDVRGFEPYEEHGELVTHQPVSVHIEEMDANLWWIGLSWTEDGETHQVSVDFSSKSRIDVRWRNDG